MMKKTFDYYRYQLVPKDYIEFDLFKKTYSIEEIKANKNIFFAKVLKEVHFANRKGKLPFKVNMANDNVYWIQLANIKSTTYIADFEEHSITTEPYVNILIDNDPTKQVIAISRNSQAYASTEQVVDIMQQALSLELKKYNLKLYISAINERDTFWNIIKKTRGQVTRIEIEIIKPNLSNISHSLKEDVRTLIEDTNSHLTTLKLESAEDGILSGITPKNENLNGIIDYSAEGGGNIKVKVRGQKELIQTKKSIKKIRVKFDIDITTNKPEEIKDVVKGVLNHIQ